MAQEITAIAIDKDKHSQCALKWAVDNLLSNDPFVVLIHVRVRNQHAPENNREKFESDVKQLFIPYRGYCARKRVGIKEVILDDMDIAEALVAYINQNYINNIVVGASTRGFLHTFTKKHDVPSQLTKTAPDFCSVYVVAKGKPVTIKTATRAPPINAPPISAPPINAPQPIMPPSSPMRQYPNPTDSPRKAVCEDNMRRSWRSEGSEGRSSSDRRIIQRDKSMATPNSSDNVFTPRSHDIMYAPRSRDVMYTPRSSDVMYTPRSSDVMYTPRSSYGRDSSVDADSCYSGSFGHQHSGGSSHEFSSLSGGDSSTSMIEVDMRRLKMELKHTMDLYSQACKEAITAKQKALEFQQWQTDEARRFEHVRLAEEAALASAQKEKAKAQAAFEAAEASKRLAEMEAKRREEFEMRALNESDERNQVVNALEASNIRYRRYEMDDIRAATNNFSDSLKIGEGGYGPVYKAYLDHTPVAVKVLKSDAAQGMKQFQQEVEVLSCIRHPNMVLLLGACPESGCLVYEYMDNGSLDDRLFRREGTPPIPWWVRFKIAAEIATGLLFLHRTKPEPLVHRDLKPGNILLDRNYVSKISDVGLARLVPPSVADSVTQYHMTSAAGTFCYIDPEYQQSGMLGTKSDVYSLEKMLLQIITARPPMGLAHNVEDSIERGTLAELLDPTITDWPVEEALSYAKLALRCAELRRKDRPDLRTEILPELNRLRTLGYSESHYLSSYLSSFNSPTNSSNFSSSTNSYNSYSHQKPPRSNEETIRDPMSRTPPRSRNGENPLKSSRRSENGEGYSPIGSSTSVSSDEGKSKLSELIPYEEYEE